MATNTDMSIPQARGIAPGNGTLVAAVTAATGKTPDLIAPFRLSRFYENELVSERGAAAVSH